MVKFNRFGILLLAGSIIATFAPRALAVKSYHYRHYHRHSTTHYVVVTPRHAALVEDADTGRVLYSENPTLAWPPASMAKMMLLLVAEDQIQAGRFSYNTPVRVSFRSATTGGSRLGLREGQVYPLGELMKAALIRSANDAAVAVAETVGGSYDGCVRMMNAKAASLGMTSTHYETIDGLPPTPGHDVDVTDALDLATLARAIIHTTNLLAWSGMETAMFDGGVAILHNTNHLVGHLDGCDGLKTGFTMQAGFNLTATAKRGDMRLISVVLGTPSNWARFSQSATLLNWGFENFTKVELLKRGEPLPVHVQVAQGETIQPIAQNDIALVLRKDEVAGLKLAYNIPPTISRPVPPGTPLGQVTVMEGGDVLARSDAISPLPTTLPSVASDPPGNDAAARTDNYTIADRPLQETR
ncbi:MAG TPA: D-alanyl-D-alanine carboxypeptidase family protein [Candidatus Binataceae bacterium]|nr:D-alanyl-D-alanine carboxypeptidase family protein [Candidatus Binataceae bacterium]